jgi:hypothetical protein
MVRGSRAKGEGGGRFSLFGFYPSFLYFASPYNRRYMCILIVLMLGRDNKKVWCFGDILESGCI